MYLQKLWFVVVTSTLLLHRCIADELLSTLKTSSGRSSYSNFESENSNLVVTPDSFSKSDSSFSASQSEVSQNDSSLVTTGDGISIQDSSYHSSNSNISSSDSNIVASDGFISQTDSSFAASSSSTAESDSSLMVTANGSVASSTQSSIKSTTSTSATTSRSVDTQLLNDGEADISFPDDFPLFGSSHQTKSLDSIPDFSSDSIDYNTFPGSPNSPSSLAFRDSALNSPGTQFESHFDNFGDIPTSHDLSDYPNVSDSLNDNSILNGISSNYPSPDGYRVSHYDSLDIPKELHPEDIDNPITADYHTNSPFAQYPSHQSYDLLKDSPILNDGSIPTAPYDSHIHPDVLASDQYSHPSTLESMDTNQDGFISPDEILESSNAIPTTPYNSNLHPDVLASDHYSYPSTLESTDINRDGLISPEEILESSNTIPTTPYNSNLHPDLLASDHYSYPSTLESMDINQDGLISPEEILESKNSIPTTPYNSNLHPEVLASDHYSYPSTLESMDINQDGLISQAEILESKNSIPTTPYDSNLHPDVLASDHYSYPSTLESMDVNQDGLISPEEMLESSNQAPKTLDSIYLDHNVSPISPEEILAEEILESNNRLMESTMSELDKSKIPDSVYFPQSGYDESINLRNTGTEYLNPEKFSPDDRLPNFPYGQPSPYQLNAGKNYPQNPKYAPFNQLLRPNGPFKPMPLPMYPGLNKSTPSGYPKPKHLPFPYNDIPSSPLSKYPSHSPYFKNKLSNYPSPYGLPPMPSSPYDYPGNFLKPSPFSRHPLRSDFYNSLPPFSQRNPLLNKPYPYPRSPLDSMQRPLYAPKDWSKIPKSKYPQTAQFLDSTANLPSVSPSVLNNQHSLVLDSPLDQSSSLLQSSYDLPAPNSPLDQPSLLPQSPYDLPPVPNSPLDQRSLLTQSPYDSLVSDSPLYQPSVSLDSSVDSPIDALNSSPLNSPSTIPYNSPLIAPHSPSPIPLDYDTNLPLTNPDYLLNNSPAYYNMDNDLFNFLKQQYESTAAEYLLSNSIYPQDIAPNFSTMTDDDLTFNFVVLGSSPAVLSALKTLSDTGKSILLIERGSLPPHISKSLYYRPKMLQSDYVRRIKSLVPNCDKEEILYAPNVLGEESTYDSNIWDYGVRSKYNKWGKLCSKWTWKNVMEYFTDGSNKPYTYAIPVTTELDTTKAIDKVTSIFNNAGLYKTAYQNGKRLEGLTVMPYLQENGENIILAENIFQQLTSYNNLRLALGTTPVSIIFDNFGKAIGVVVKTPCGATKTITILDELIIGSNPIDIVQFLYQSGIGDQEKLQQLNIPTQINLPYVGKELIITPQYFGVIYLFPQGTLLSNQESDFAGMNYLFGNYGLPSALALDYFKAALNIYGSHEANVVLNFKAFSKSMSERLNSYIERLTHIDGKIKDFLTNLCQEYDILLAVPQLTNALSRGEIMIGRSNGELEVLVNTGMYQSKRDMTIMQKALKVLNSIAETETFKSMNGKVVQIPVEQCGTPDFSIQYNQCSIRYLSQPNLHYCGGTIMGVDPLTSVVNEDLLVHGTTNVRIFSTGVVPYGTSTDSSAVSSVIGNLGAHILLQKYFT